VRLAAARARLAADGAMLRYIMAACPLHLIRHLRAAWAQQRQGQQRLGAPLIHPLHTTGWPAGGISAAPAAPAAPGGRCVHALVLVHGLNGGAADLRLLRDWARAADPAAAVLLSTANAGRTAAGSIAEMGARLAAEVDAWLGRRARAGSPPPGRLSLVGHSMGALIARAAAAHPRLAPHRHLLWAFVSLAGPHCGVASGTSWGAGVGLRAMAAASAARSGGSGAPVFRELVLEDGGAAARWQARWSGGGAGGGAYSACSSGDGGPGPGAGTSSSGALSLGCSGAALTLSPGAGSPGGGPACTDSAAAACLPAAPRVPYLAQLAHEPGLEAFRHVLLLASRQDGYVPFASALCLGPATAPAGGGEGAEEPVGEEGEQGEAAAGDERRGPAAPRAAIRRGHSAQLAPAVGSRRFKQQHLAAVLSGRLGGPGQVLARGEVRFALGPLGGLANRVAAGGLAHLEFVRSKALAGEVVEGLLLAAGALAADPAAWL
jgi:hypothetical protein